jgi:hypothetical protein
VYLDYLGVECCHAEAILNPVTIRQSPGLLRLGDFWQAARKAEVFDHFDL